MASTENYVIVVENNGTVEEEINLTGNEDYYAVFSEMHRMGYEGDIYTLYRVENGARAVMESYPQSDPNNITYGK